MDAKVLLRWQDPDEVGRMVTGRGEEVAPELAQRAWQIVTQVHHEAEEHFSRPGREDPSVSLASFCWTRAGALAGASLPALEPLLAGLFATVAEYAAEELEHVSLALYGSSRELEGGDVTVPGGLAGLVRGLEAALPAGAVRLGTEVTGVSWGPASCLLTTRTGARLACQHAVIALPLGVMQARHEDLFSPALPPGMVAALDSLHAGRLSKVFLHWAAPWWPEGEGGLRIARSREEREAGDWTAAIPGFAEVAGQPGVLLFWVVGAMAETVDDLPDETIAEGAARVLREALGRPELPAPCLVLRHPWSRDPFTLGAYSVPSTRASAGAQAVLAAPLPSPAAPRLLLAGEHVSPEFWSFLHGARDSGLAQAARILQWRQAQGKD